MKLDFFTIKHRVTEKRNGTQIDVYPEFLIKKSKDLMIRGGKFYAALNKETGFWETSEIQIQEYVDEELKAYAETNKDILQEKAEKGKFCKVNLMEMQASRSRSWIEWKTYVNNLPDWYVQLDDEICFNVEKVKPEQYLSRKLQ